MAEAIDLVASKRDADGRWPLEVRYPGQMPIELEGGEGLPSRWNTLRALRVGLVFSTSLAQIPCRGRELLGLARPVKIPNRKLSFPGSEPMLVS